MNDGAANGTTQTRNKAERRRFVCAIAMAVTSLSPQTCHPLISNREHSLKTNSRHKCQRSVTIPLPGRYPNATGGTETVPQQTNSTRKFQSVTEIR
eukprot:855599-Rhodomonas_salina.1